MTTVKRKITEYYRVEDGIIHLNKRSANGVPFDELKFIEECRKLEILLRNREDTMKAEGNWPPKRVEPDMDSLEHIDLK